MIRGLGIDLVTVSRIAALISRYGDRFKAKVFTEQERRYCETYAEPAQHYAARFAAKEATLKALGVPRGLRWHEMEVASGSGRQPTLRLTGAAEAAAEGLGISQTLLSLTHEGDVAAAVVVAEG